MDLGSGDLLRTNKLQIYFWKLTLNNKLWNQIWNSPINIGSSMNIMGFKVKKIEVCFSIFFLNYFEICSFEVNHSSFGRGIPRYDGVAWMSDGLNFINALRTAFTLADPESVKSYWWLNCIFYTFGIYERKSCM